MSSNPRREASAEPTDVEGRRDEALRLLPRIRELNTRELRALAQHLRILANVAEAWAQRGINAADE